MRIVFLFFILVISILLSCSSNNTPPPESKGLDATFFSKKRPNWTKEDLFHVIDAHRPMLTEIYEYFLKKYSRTEFRGIIKVSIQVSPNGKVNSSKTKLESEKLKKFKRFISRLKSDIDTWSFAPVQTTKSVTVNFRLVFEPKKE